MKYLEALRKYAQENPGEIKRIYEWAADHGKVWAPSRFKELDMLGTELAMRFTPDGGKRPYYWVIGTQCAFEGTHFGNNSWFDRSDFMTLVDHVLPVKTLADLEYSNVIDDIVIVTRHKAAVEWLQMQGIEGPVLEHASVADVQDKHVYGVLPLHLAAFATRVTTIDLPRLPKGKRGFELDLDEMIEAGATLTTYVVMRQ